jgi:endonuclease YncB( thermonuclease family)
VPGGTEVIVTSVGWDKYANRADCTVFVPGIGDLATRLIADGYAVEWDGTGPRPVPPWPIR